jgi:hypothetical protein
MGTVVNAYLRVAIGRYIGFDISQELDWDRLRKQGMPGLFLLNVYAGLRIKSPTSTWAMLICSLFYILGMLAFSF